MRFVSDSAWWLLHEQLLYVSLYLLSLVFNASECGLRDNHYSCHRCADKALPAYCSESHISIAAAVLPNHWTIKLPHLQLGCVTALALKWLRVVLRNVEHACVAGIKKCVPHDKSRTMSTSINWNECGIGRSTGCGNTKTLRVPPMGCTGS